MNNQETTYSAVLGVVLTNLRKAQKKEQGEMAILMGLSQASYSRLESGKSSFSVDQMYQAATALGLNEDTISLKLNSTINSLKSNGVVVVPQLRANTTLVKQEGAATAGSFVMGAALAALMIGLLSK